MLLNQKNAGELLKKYSIPVPRTFVFENPFFDKNINYPVVLKVDSPEIIHKSDFGVIFLDLKNQEEVNRALKTEMTILKMHNIIDYKFVVQEMIKGQELILGMKRDKTFGPVILFGIGGIFVEVLKDFSIRIAPLKKKDCFEMISELRGKKLLEGYRNTKPVNKDKIVELLIKLSNMAIKEKNISEIDFNPVIIDDKKAYVVDARMIQNA
jgi:acyl-CoA synthetase (NDP forming)